MHMAQRKHHGAFSGKHMNFIRQLNRLKKGQYTTCAAKLCTPMWRIVLFFLKCFSSWNLLYKVPSEQFYSFPQFLVQLQQWLPPSQWAPEKHNQEKKPTNHCTPHKFLEQMCQPSLNSQTLFGHGTWARAEKRLRVQASVSHVWSSY